MLIISIFQIKHITFFFQLQYAAILSSIYVIVMVVVLIGVIRASVTEGLCSMTTIFLLFVAGVFVIAALIHPKVPYFEKKNVSRLTFTHHIFK